MKLAYGLALLNWLYPKRCLLCRNPLSYLDLRHLCPTCQWNIKRLKTSHEDFIYSYGPFEGNLRELIHLFKYKGKDYLSWELSEILYKVWQESPKFKELEMILPVPLHSSHLRERGYNQSTLLAKDLVARIQKNNSSPYLIHFFSDVLIISRKTKSQTLLSREERKDNVKDAFLLRTSDVIDNKNVLLIDDVYTTGATLASCREILLNNGAKKVFALTLARD